MASALIACRADLGVTSDLTVTGEAITLALQNHGSNDYLVMDSGVVAPLSESGTVIANTMVSMPYTPPKQLKAGGSLELGRAARVATTD